MHILSWNAYCAAITRAQKATEEEGDGDSDGSVVMQYVRPRLCDAIATVLFETSSKCLDAFLDPTVKVFEWRHEYSGSSRRLCVVIRREGNEVIVSLYPIPSPSSRPFIGLN